MSTTQAVTHTPTAGGHHPYSQGLSAEEQQAMSALAAVITNEMAATPACHIDAACGVLNASPEALRNALRALVGVLDLVCERKVPEPATGPGLWPYGPGEDHQCVLNNLVNADGRLYAPCCGLDLT